MFYHAGILYQNVKKRNLLDAFEFFSRNQPFLNVLEYQNANHMRRQPLSRGIKF